MMKPRILIAEDTADSRDFFATALRRTGCIEAVKDGSEALECYKTRRQAGVPYALLILDVAMPGLNGFQVAEAIRDGGDDETPIVFLTAYAEPETTGRAIRSNATVWAKPILDNELVAKVRGILER